MGERAAAKWGKSGDFRQRVTSDKNCFRDGGFGVFSGTFMGAAVGGAERAMSAMPGLAMGAAPAPTGPPATPVPAWKYIATKGASCGVFFGSYYTLKCGLRVLKIGDDQPKYVTNFGCGALTALPFYALKQRNHLATFAFLVLADTFNLRDLIGGGDA